MIFIKEIKKNFFNETIKLYEKEQIQYFCLKFKFEGIIYSIDFFFETFLDRFISELSNDKLYFKITNKPQTNSYKQGCNKKRLIIPKINQKFIYSYSVSSPQYTINENNYYIGILFDKILTGYFKISEKNSFEDKFSNFISKYILFIKEKNNFTSNKYILNSLNRCERFNDEYKVERITYFDNILKKFK